jgi:glycyl-tRNA synthetase beta subunit
MEASFKNARALRLSCRLEQQQRDTAREIEAKNIAREHQRLERQRMEVMQPDAQPQSVRQDAIVANYGQRRQVTPMSAVWMSCLTSAE